MRVAPQPLIIIGRVPADNADMSSAATANGASAARRFRVLIAGATDADRAFLDRVLRQPGYDIVTAADALAAIERAESDGPFDLLVADTAIAGMPGDELARRLRRTHPELKILYLTEPSGSLLEERTALWEEEAFLDKPVTAQGLLEAAALLLVGQLPAPRAVRVDVPNARVRYSNNVGELVKLSETGGLIRAADPLTVGSSWRFDLELPSETLRLTGRVVSCDASPSRDPRTAAKPYAVAIAFVQPSAAARRALQRIVQAHRT